MNIIKAKYDIIHFDPITDINRICYGICLCYKTKLPSTYEERCKLVEKVKNKNHGSVLEHSSASVAFTINRGVSHELVRHRHTAFSQESTRWCNYSKDKFNSELTFIDNSAIKDSIDYGNWIRSLADIEDGYFSLLKHHSPEEARGILPNDLKTEILVTTNYREWREIFKLRCNSRAHYQMREIMRPLLDEFKKECPCVFGDISY